MADGVEQKGQSRSRHHGHIDDKWPEVLFINHYTVFMGYLSMAVKGTGLLVFTWSTVVLLGGFVPILAKKDFWSLTVITLVQTRIFDVFLNGNISYFGYSFKGLWKAALSIALPRVAFQRWRVSGLIRVLVFTGALCPLFALHMFGLFVSPVISLWRLVQQDFGDKQAGDVDIANLKPALLLLYSLALFQGMLFCYSRFLSYFEEQRLLKLVATAYLLDDNDRARESLSDYLHETMVGCEKNPSFARGRNLATYAAELMQSNSPDNYPSGVRILHMLMMRSNDASNSSMTEIQRVRVRNMVNSQHMLISTMIGSTSCGAINKLVQMLDYDSSRYDSKEIRQRAMWLVAHFASEIHLNKVPHGVQCISSFLDKPQAWRNKQISIHILLKLTDDKENLSLMRNTSGLALKVIRLIVRSDSEFHVHDDSEHDKWCSSVALPGMEVIKRFIMPVVTGNSIKSFLLPREVLQKTDAISTLESILSCNRCKMKEELQVSVIVVVTHIISMDTSLAPLLGDEVRDRLIWSLIDMFLDGSDNDINLKKLAGESLAQLSLASKESATLIQEANNGDIVDKLTKVLLDVNSKYRKSAANILKHLCSHHTTNGDKHRFEKLKSAMIEQVIPEALTEALAGSCDVEVKQALSSLCATVYERLISVEPDMAPLFEHIAAEISQHMNKRTVMAFPDLVKQAAEISMEMKVEAGGNLRRPWRAGPAANMVYEEENPNTACCIS